MADTKVGLTTEADLRRLYEELEACRLREVRSVGHCTWFYALDRLAAVGSFILRSASHLAATVNEFGWVLVRRPLKRRPQRALPDQQ